MHRQIQKTVGSTSTRYYYAGWQRLADYSGTTLQNRYVYGTTLEEALIEVSSAGVLTYLHADRIGSVIATTNSSGAVTNKYAYGPYGESAAISGSSVGYVGQRYDSETGLYFAKRRYYSPNIGRFLQPDPIGPLVLGSDDDCGCGCSAEPKLSGYCFSPRDELSFYDYVNNDPLNNTDSYGMAPGDVFNPGVPQPGMTLGEFGTLVASYGLAAAIKLWFKLGLLNECINNAWNTYNQTVLDAKKRCKTDEEFQKAMEKAAEDRNETIKDCFSDNGFTRPL